MKSAAFQNVFQRVGVGVSRYARNVGISLRSLLGQGELLLGSHIAAHGRHRYVSRKVLALYIQGQNAGGTAEF